MSKQKNEFTTSVIKTQHGFELLVFSIMCKHNEFQSTKHVHFVLNANNTLQPTESEKSRGLLQTLLSTFKAFVKHLHKFHLSLSTSTLHSYAMYNQPRFLTGSQLWLPSGSKTSCRFTSIET